MAEYNKSMPVMPDEPLESEEESQLIGTSSVNIKFSQNIVGLEIANHSTDATIFLQIDGSTASTSTGIPIYAKTFYTADKVIIQSVGISLISDTPATDVRIMGHYFLISENDGSI